MNEFHIDIKGDKIAFVPPNSFTNGLICNFTRLIGLQFIANMTIRSPLKYGRNQLIFNRLRYIISLLFLTLAMEVSIAGEKRALLIGISDYPTVKGHPELEWSDIHGANDVATITPTLKRQGFKTTSLTNHKATAANIRKALRQLDATVGIGDLIYIHFSGHGQAVEDKNGDEADGWDEAIIPYDARIKYAKGIYEGENHILDDELEMYFTSIRSKIGPKGYLYVVLDACHMGGASRGEEEEENEVFVRGTDKGFSPSGKRYIPKIDRRGNMKINSHGANLSGVCILEACRAYQTNAEIKQNSTYYGPLTYYINQYLTGKEITPNNSWVESVRALMNKDKRLIKQNMVIESNQ